MPMSTFPDGIALGQIVERAGVLSARGKDLCNSVIDVNQLNNSTSQLKDTDQFLHFSSLD